MRAIIAAMLLLIWRPQPQSINQSVQRSTSFLFSFRTLNPNFGPSTFSPAFQSLPPPSQSRSSRTAFISCSHECRILFSLALLTLPLSRARLRERVKGHKGEIRMPGGASQKGKCCVNQNRNGLSVQRKIGRNFNLQFRNVDRI